MALSYFDLNRIQIRVIDSMIVTKNARFAAGIKTYNEQLLVEAEIRALTELAEKLKAEVDESMNKCTSGGI